jgi:hypothetical protein
VVLFLLRMNSRVRFYLIGKITFHEMTKSIAEKWRNVDAETRAYCEMIANEELERHKREVAEFKERYGEEAFKALSSSGKSKEKRKHEQSEDEVEESDSNVANNLNEQSDTSGVTYPGEVRSSQPNETSITSQMMNNLNQQTNRTAFTNNLIPQLNNSISASFAAASLPTYEANPYASFSMPQLPSDRLNAMQTNNFTGQLNNVWTAYAAAAQQDFIRSKLIELQQQSQMSSEYLGATVQSSASQVGQGLLGSCSQHYGAAAASNQAVMPQSQDQKLPDDFPDDVSEALGLAENGGDNSKDGAKVTSDGDEE